MKAKVDRDECIGCGLCASICSAVFEMDEEGIAIVIADPVPADVKEEAIEAEESCPTGAISLEE